MGSSGANPGTVASLSLLTTGEEAITREIIDSEDLPDTGTLFCTFFTARKTEAISKFFTSTLGQAAAGTTLARIGIYQSTGGTSTLIAASASDVTLWANTFRTYQVPIAGTFNKVASTRYAVGLLWIGATPPLLPIQTINFQTAGPGASGGNPTMAPMLQLEITGQADLPATINENAQSNGFRRFQMIMLP